MNFSWGLLKGYVLLGVSAVYLRWVYTLGLPGWVTFLAWFFNPYTVYGLVAMFINRRNLVFAYEMAVDSWRELKGKPKIYSDEDES